MSDDNVVVDVHPSWSGPCELMYPTYKQISTSIDDFEKRIEFGVLDLDKLKTIRTEKDKYFQSICQPKFLFILEGKVVDEVNGANIPLIMEKIMKYVPLSL